MEDSNMAKAQMTKAKAKAPLSEAEKVRIRKALQAVLSPVSDDNPGACVPADQQLPAHGRTGDRLQEDRLLPGHLQKPMGRPEQLQIPVQQ